MQSHVTVALRCDLAAAGVDEGSLPAFGVRRACSSAAGGLSMVALGLAPELTAEAARRAALGAGAVVRRVFSYRLTADDVAEMVGWPLTSSCWPGAPTRGRAAPYCTTLVSWRRRRWQGRSRRQC
ncbi:MAG: hypothetical protein GX605_13460 [Chloroflexi bacterium]|nr:hypothetical protein [Chloroflexota bacterium]